MSDQVTESISTGNEVRDRRVALAMAFADMNGPEGGEEGEGQEPATDQLSAAESALRARLAYQRGGEDAEPAEEAEPQEADPGATAEPQAAEPPRGSREWMVAKARADAAARAAKAQGSEESDYRRQLEQERRAREDAERAARTPRDEVLAGFRRDPVSFLREAGLDPVEALKTLQSAAINPEGRRAETAAQEAERLAKASLERVEKMERQLQEERSRLEEERRAQSQILAFHRLVDQNAKDLPAFQAMPESRRLGVVRAVLAEMHEVGIDSPSDEDVAYAAEEFLRSVAGTRGAEAPKGKPQPIAAQAAPTSGRKTITGAESSQRTAPRQPRGLESPEERRLALARAVEGTKW